MLLGSWDHTSVLAKWDLIPPAALAECTSVTDDTHIHTYIRAYRQTDHATVTCVAISVIAFSDAA